MKKIIAAAVATAFVAPAFAADVTVGGSIDYSYVDTSSSTSTTKQIEEDTTVSIKATTELANGITVSADFTVNQAYGGDGSSIDVSGAFGKVSLGDSAGAVDTIDGGVSIDKTVKINSYESTDTFSGLTPDVAVRWDLPAIVPNLSIAITHSPKDGTNAIGAGEQSTASKATVADVNGYVAQYDAGVAKIGYASEETGTTKYDGYVLSGDFGPVAASYEAWDKQVPAASVKSLNAITVKYTMGDIVLAARQADVKDGSSVLSDVNSFFINYSLGSGVTLYAETSSEQKLATNNEETAVGIAYSF